jgi:hypothetical protein
MAAITSADAGKLLLDLLDGGGGALWAILPGILIGGAVGIVVALCLYYGLRQARAWELKWKHAIWVKRLVLVFLLIGVGISGALIGGAQGASKFACESLWQGRLRKHSLDHAGNASASAVLALDISLQNYLATGNVSAFTAEQVEQQRKFDAGETELHTGDFFGRLKKAESKLASEFSPAVKAQIHTSAGVAPGSLIASIADSFVDLFIAAALRQSLTSKLDPQISAALTNCVATLPQAAAATGDPATISHRELSIHIVENGIVAIVESPVRRFFRSYQIAIALITLASLALILLGFKFARRRMEKLQFAAAAETVSVESA